MDAQVDLDLRSHSPAALARRLARVANGLGR